MKKRSIFKRGNPALPIISFALCSFLLASCSNNNNETVTSPPDAAALAKDTLFSVQIVDTEGNTVEGATVNITSDPDDIIVDAQESQVTGSTPAGLVTYAPSEFTGNKTLQVIASKDGYLANNLPLEITGGKTNETSIVITNIASASNTTGISAVASTGDSSTAAVTATAKEGDGAGDSKTVVEIPIDPGAKTEDGKELGKDLSITIAQYDSDETPSLDAFPGGLAVTIENPADLSNSTDQPTDGVAPTEGGIVFESAGFTAIEVKDSEGNVAKTFNKPVEVSTKIKPGFINPATGVAVKVGDTIPIWSYEASTGKWKYEKTGTIVGDPDGGLKVDYTVTHLSYYNLDYYGGGRCDATVNFKDTNGANVALSGRVKNQGWSHVFKYPGDDVLTLRNAPSNRTVTFTDLKTVTGLDITLVSPVAPVNLCNGPVNVIVTPPAVVNSELTASAHTYCSNDATVAEAPISGTYIWIFSDGTWNHIGSAKTGATGETTFTLPVGTYRVAVYDVVSRKYIFDSITLTSGTTGTAALRVPQVCEVTTTTGATN